MGKEVLEETENYTAFAEELYRRNPEICIITNELGYGVVPLEAFDRRYREATGRICTELAKRSSKVTRVVLGQGQVIKHA